MLELHQDNDHRATDEGFDMPFVRPFARSHFRLNVWCEDRLNDLRGVRQATQALHQPVGRFLSAVGQKSGHGISLEVLPKPFSMGLKSSLQGAEIERLDGVPEPQAPFTPAAVAQDVFEAAADERQIPG